MTFDGIPISLKHIQTTFIKRNILSYSILILTCLSAYFPTFQNQFQDFWDDQWVVMNSYTEDGFTLTNLQKILTEFYHGQYAPVNQLFYTSFYWLFGYNPFWFHAACLLAHVLNVILIFTFIKKLLALSKDFEPSATWRIAFITALLFAIHPFLVEAVVWVSASKIVLYSLFYLTALHCYLRYTVDLKLRYYLATLFFFILSFGAKEQAVTLPLCLVLVDFALKRSFKDIQLWLEKLPLVILSASFGIFTMLSQAVTGSGALTGSASYSFIQKIIFASYALFEYFFKCLIPYKLSYLYPFPNPVGYPVAMRFWPYPFVLIAVVILLWSFWRRRWVFFGIIFFVLHIAVALHIIPISRFVIVADRYVYLASVGIFFIVAFLLNSAISLKNKYYKIILGISACYLCALVIYTNTYVRVWYDSDTLKKDVRQLIKQRKDTRPDF